MYKFAILSLMCVAAASAGILPISSPVISSVDPWALSAPVVKYVQAPQPLILPQVPVVKTIPAPISIPQPIPIVKSLPISYVKTVVPQSPVYVKTISTIPQPISVVKSIGVPQYSTCLYPNEVSQRQTVAAVGVGRSRVGAVGHSRCSGVGSVVGRVAGRRGGGRVDDWTGRVAQRQNSGVGTGHQGGEQHYELVHDDWYWIDREVEVSSRLLGCSTNQLLGLLRFLRSCTGCPCVLQRLLALHLQLRLWPASGLLLFGIQTLLRGISIRVRHILNRLSCKLDERKIVSE
ncbi:unnamed protein product [Trichogramma brassicae]|uniref:Uncharacterized protein n=1 Tax=Trichogramma brassicae TaxID=86971 RepID=A0A6H5HY45_9HYME|nr:unnamed protein product [Trichogramma brassicae]